MTAGRAQRVDPADELARGHSKTVGQRCPGVNSRVRPVRSAVGLEAEPDPGPQRTLRCSTSGGIASGIFAVFDRAPNPTENARTPLPRSRLLRCLSWFACFGALTSAAAIVAGTMSLPETDAAVRDRVIGTSLFMPDGVACVPCRRSRPGLRSLGAFTGQEVILHASLSHQGLGLRRKRPRSGVLMEPLDIVGHWPLGFEPLLETIGRTVSSGAGAECAIEAS